MDDAPSAQLVESKPVSSDDSPPPRAPRPAAPKASRRRTAIMIPVAVGLVALVLGAIAAASLMDPRRAQVTVPAIPQATRAAATQVTSVIPLGAFVQSIAIDETNGLAYVTRLADPAQVKPDDDETRRGTLSFVELASQRVVATVRVGIDPIGVAVDEPSGTVWVANSGDRSLTAVSVASRTAVGTVAVGEGPRHIAVDEATGLVYVTNTDEDSVTVVDGRSRAIIDWMGVPARPHGVAFQKNGGRLFVTNSEGGTTEVIDPRAPQATFRVGERPFDVGVDEDLGSVYISNWGANTVTVVEAATHRWWDTITVGERPFGVSVDLPARSVYVANWASNSVSVIDANTRKVSATVNVGARPTSVAVDQRNGQVYVVNSGEGNVSVLGPAPQPAPDPATAAPDPAAQSATPGAASPQPARTP